jgi:glycopeptide antibiotics resistance protein
MQILDKNVLSLTWDRLNFDSRFVRDIIMNLIGFIPLGFFLNATFVKAGGSFERHGVLTTVVFCFTVSLAIEILQAWMPSRSSDCLDLLLNTLGALLGVMIYKFLFTGWELGSRGGRKNGRFEE